MLTLGSVPSPSGVRWLPGREEREARFTHAQARASGRRVPRVRPL